MCMLHGVTMLHVDATPTCDFLKSSAVNPTACNIARLAARSAPSTTIEENARSAESFDLPLRRAPLSNWLLISEELAYAGRTRLPSLAVPRMRYGRHPGSAPPCVSDCPREGFRLRPQPWR